MKLASLRSLVACTFFGGALLVACSSGDSTGNGFDFGDSGLGHDGGTSSGASSGSSSGSSGGSSGSSSGGSSGGDFDSGSSSGSSSGSTSSSGSSSGSGGSCGACTTDSECQSACPPVQGGGTNCCDVGSGVCYATTQTTCPVPSDGGGGG